MKREYPKRLTTSNSKSEPTANNNWASLLLSYFLQDNFHNLSKVESFFIEASLLCKFYEGLSLKFLKNDEKRFYLTDMQEEEMLNTSFLKHVINDIVSTGEYTVEGIANSIHLPPDVIYEVATGINRHPSATLLIKVLKIHATLRRDLYHELIENIITEME